MDIQEYISKKHNGKREWFLDEINTVQNLQRIRKILDIKEYLTGKHSILNKPAEMWNGQLYEPKKIVLQYAKTTLNFSTSYLLQHPVTLVGEDNVVDNYKRVYKRGKYNRVDSNILNHVVKYGNAYEYVYLDGKKNIKSKLIDPADSFPVLNDEGEMIGFIEHYTVDAISYYTIYYPDRVEKWNNEGGQLFKVNEYSNLSGLPVAYKNENEIDDFYGRSELEDIISILDNMEGLLSKSVEAFDKYITGIPVVTGQQLKGDGLPKDIIGGGIVLDDGATFDFKSNSFDRSAFETLFKTLKQALLDVSHTPAVSINSQDVSNLSEVSMKLLFSLADIKAGLNEKNIREGLEERFERIKGLLGYKGIELSEEDFDSLSVVFQYSRPVNEVDIIENLEKLKEMGAISIESALGHSPYTNDVKVEMGRLESEAKSRSDNKNNSDDG